MSNVDHRRVRRGQRMLVAVGLSAVLLAGCGRASTVEVSASGSLPPAPPSTAGGPTESFQGAVASIDPVTNELVVNVQIVWAPVIKADRHERRVAVGPQTRWQPAATGLDLLRVGDEVQVEAVSRPDGTWEARQVQLFDID